MLASKITHLLSNFIMYIYSPHLMVSSLMGLFGGMSTVAATA